MDIVRDVRIFILKQFCIEYYGKVNILSIIALSMLFDGTSTIAVLIEWNISK